MLAGPRYSLYRWLLARVTAKGFSDQDVHPLEVPTNDDIEVEPLAPEFPRLFRAKNYPATEHADGRVRDVAKRARLLPLVTRLPASSTRPIADDHTGLLADIYPARYRKIWARAPVVPPELEAADPLAALAVGGPFALYLQRASTADDLESVAGGRIGPDDYVIDMRVLERYPTKPGLVAPGGLAVFTVDGDRLGTVGVLSGGRFHESSEPSFDRALRVLLCGLNEHLTTLVHNVTFHLGYVTPMAVATTNELEPDHPIRRLIHPALQTTLIGNHELATFQVVGAAGFSTRLFSHDYQTLVGMIDDHLERFRVADLDPEVALVRQGLRGAPFELPLWDDAMALWVINRRYVERYVEHYYVDDVAVAADAQLAQWAETLDRLLPAGLYDDAGYLTAGEPLDRGTLARVCATFLHVSSATHDVVNNVVWDYSTLNYAIPTVVPESFENQDVRLSFDFLNTLIGTWKPFNMVLDGYSALALDDGAKRIMDDYVTNLKRRQATMGAEPGPPGRIFPAALNPSVSN